VKITSELIIFYDDVIFSSCFIYYILYLTK